MNVHIDCAGPEGSIWKQRFWPRIYLRLAALSTFSFPRIPVVYSHAIQLAADCIDNNKWFRPPTECESYYQIIDKFIDAVWYTVVMYITIRDKKWFAPYLLGLYVFHVGAQVMWLGSGRNLQKEVIETWDHSLGVFFESVFVFYGFDHFYPNTNHLLQVIIAFMFIPIKLYICKNISKAMCH